MDYTIQASLKCLPIDFHIMWNWMEINSCMEHKEKNI